MNRSVVAGLCIALLLVCGCVSSPPTSKPPATTVATLPVQTTPVPDVTKEILLPTLSPVMVSPRPTEQNPLLSLHSPAIVREGENVTLNGTTILTPGQGLLVEVISASFGPQPKTGDSSFYGASGVVFVEKGTRDAENTWSFSFSTKGFGPDTYLVTVSGVTVNVTASTTFRLER
ncbi:MAG: hypothetical protein LUQ25_08480 [Methanoregulaceae archaeon]|nr:hypothetical protein [Methanoregulaceae archaeon]